MTSIEFSNISFVKENQTILNEINWVVNSGERWAVLGLNGCGKTSLLRIAGLYLHPSSGAIKILDNELGKFDVRTLRKRIGFSSQAVVDMIRPNIKTSEVVVTGLHAEQLIHLYTATIDQLQLYLEF